MGFLCLVGLKTVCVECLGEVSNGFPVFGWLEDCMFRVSGCIAGNCIYNSTW